MDLQTLLREAMAFEQSLRDQQSISVEQHSTPNVNAMENCSHSNTPDDHHYGNEDGEVLAYNTRNSNRLKPRSPSVQFRKPC